MSLLTNQDIKTGKIKCLVCPQKGNRGAFCLFPVWRLEPQGLCGHFLRKGYRSTFVRNRIWKWGQSFCQIPFAVSCVAIALVLLVHSKLLLCRTGLIVRGAYSCCETYGRIIFSAFSFAAECFLEYFFLQLCWSARCSKSKAFSENENIQTNLLEAVGWCRKLWFLQDITQLSGFWLNKLQSSAPCKWSG